nr:cinnamoyl-CoA reductase 2-like [Tanacetum cinerariifolium]
MEHDGSFTKLFIINTPDNLIRNILGFRKNGELVMETEKDFEIGSENGSALEVYESCSKCIKNLGIYGKEDDEEKNGHSKKLENAEESLHLFKADLLNYEGLCDAFSCCNGVLHVASPVPGRHVSNPQLELLDPAILGTQNVLNACLKAKVEKVVVVSSGSAILWNPDWPSDKEMDESCWTDIEYAQSLDEGRSGGLTMENIERPYVDVRDLSDAILLLFENPKSEGTMVTMNSDYFLSPWEDAFSFSFNRDGIPVSNHVGDGFDSFRDNVEPLGTTLNDSYVEKKGQTMAVAMVKEMGTCQVGDVDLLPSYGGEKVGLITPSPSTDVKEMCISYYHGFDHVEISYGLNSGSYAIPNQRVNIGSNILICSQNILEI